MGDAIAVSLLACKDFSDRDFARFHPGGILGKRLHLRLADILSDDGSPEVDEDASINDVIIEISQKRLGATAVIKNKELSGIITDGDLRRMLEQTESFSDLLAKDIMNVTPKIISIDSLAYDALQIMEINNISQIVVMKKGIYVGIVHIHEILKEGII